MECFGSWGVDEYCQLCDYADACKFAKNNELEIKQRDNQYEGRKGCRKLNENIECDALQAFLTSSQQTFSVSEIAEMINFLLQLKTDATISEVIRQRLQEDRPLSRIAESIGISRQTLHARVGSALAEICGYHRQKTKKPLDLGMLPDDYAYCYYRKQGMSIRQIAKKLQVSVGKIHKLKQKNEHFLATKKEKN